MTKPRAHDEAETLRELLALNRAEYAAVHIRLVAFEAWVREDECEAMVERAAAEARKKQK